MPSGSPFLQKYTNGRTVLREGYDRQLAIRGKLVMSNGLTRKMDLFCYVVIEPLFSTILKKYAGMVDDEID